MDASISAWDRQVTVDQIEVRWPDGHSETRENVPAGSVLVWTQEKGRSISSGR